MKKYEISEPLEEPKVSLIRKIITWIIVLSVIAMLILILIFQPRFFTFVK